MIDEMWARVGHNLIDRVTGPMKFRLVLQPGMAAFFAIRKGLADARLGRTPYFWGLLTGSSNRREMAIDGWKGIGRVFILAVLMDAVYQLIEEHFIYPGEMLIVAFVLAIVPYLIFRGLVTRVARRVEARPEHDPPKPVSAARP